MAPAFALTMHQVTEEFAGWLSVFRLFSLRSWLVTTIGGLASLVLIGIPTAIIHNPFFSRQTPVRTQDYLVWMATGVLMGLIAGTYALTRETRSSGKVASGGVLSFLAVGCPICNKLAVLLLGTSGALSYFAPAQLYIGIASLALLGWALRLRLQAIKRTSCTVIQ